LFLHHNSLIPLSAVPPLRGPRTRVAAVHLPLSPHHRRSALDPLRLHRRLPSASNKQPRKRRSWKDLFWSRASSLRLRTTLRSFMPFFFVPALTTRRVFSLLTLSLLSVSRWSGLKNHSRVLATQLEKADTSSLLA
jgi:hypothetical protein